MKEKKVLQFCNDFICILVLQTKINIYNVHNVKMNRHSKIENEINILYQHTRSIIYL